jgi:hypothetical protein
VAGAFLNLEPLIGAVLGIVAFGDPAGARQFTGGVGIIVGIGLSSLPLFSGQQLSGRPSGRQLPGRPLPVPGMAERDNGPRTRVA